MRAYSESRVRDRGLPIVSCGEPKFVPSTANCTVPPLSKVPEPGVTVAVKVTVWPETAGLAEAVTAVLVLTVPLR